MTREITHMKALAAALDGMEKPRFSVGRIAPSKPLVDQYFNDSTGEGDMGEIDTRGLRTRAARGKSWTRPPSRRRAT